MKLDAMALSDEIILREVESRLDAMHLGFSFSPADQAVLDNPQNADKNRILAIEDRLPVSLRNDLYRIANSPLYAKSGREQAADFWEVAMILGIENIKAYIFSSALFGGAADNSDIQALKNRCLTTAGLSMAIIHNVLGLDRNLLPKVQLCALVSEFGKIPLFLYRQQHGGESDVAGLMTEEFINRHHGRLGLLMVDRFRLPSFLKDLFDKKSLIFFEGVHEFSITTIVRMVKLLVRDSFRHHGKLLLTSVLDDPFGVVSGSVGTEIQKFFDSLGVGHLVEIIPYETPAQQYARQKKERH